ncbi:MAG TPA: endonuclease domain-containing protein [Sphingomicrobium sp.]|nr:endonuclease domain-containing protein [Sphingomicrobium sp.]
MRLNPTAAEKRLWSMLRDRRMPSFKFKRQFVIAPYIVDFICFERRLIVETDGSQHAESEYDRRRDAFLRSEDFSVSASGTMTSSKTPAASLRPYMLN